MPSSPPCLPDYESLPPTPCPVQHHTRLQDSLRDLIKEGRAAAEASHSDEGDTIIARFVGETVPGGDTAWLPEQSLPQL
jgi:hypothetical protein